MENFQYSLLLSIIYAYFILDQMLCDNVVNDIHLGTVEQTQLRELQNKMFSKDRRNLVLVFHFYRLHLLLDYTLIVYHSLWTTQNS